MSPPFSLSMQRNMCVNITNTGVRTGKHLAIPETEKRLRFAQKALCPWAEGLGCYLPYSTYLGLTAPDGRGRGGFGWGLKGLVCYISDPIPAKSCPSIISLFMVSSFGLHVAYVILAHSAHIGYLHQEGLVGTSILSSYCFALYWCKNWYLHISVISVPGSLLYLKL